MHPTGPKIKRSIPVDEIFDKMHQMLVNVQQKGVDITADYMLPNGQVCGFTFHGAPFKDKSLETIDAALAWEVTEFAKRMGWE